jgi:hypothetical protein
MAGQSVCLLIFLIPSPRLELQILAGYNMISVTLYAYWYIQRVPYKSTTLGGKNMLQQGTVTNREQFMTMYIITFEASNFTLTPHYVCLSTV